MSFTRSVSARKPFARTSTLESLGEIVKNTANLGKVSNVKRGDLDPGFRKSRLDIGTQRLHGFHPAGTEDKIVA